MLRVYLSIISIICITQISYAACRGCCRGHGGVVCNGDTASCQDGSEMSDNCKACSMCNTNEYGSKAKIKQCKDEYMQEKERCKDEKAISIESIKAEYKDAIQYCNNNKTDLNDYKICRSEARGKRDSDMEYARDPYAACITNATDSYQSCKSDPE